MAYSRFRLLLFSFLVFFSLLVFRLIKIQIIDHNKYENLAVQQHWRTLEITPERGRIYSADGLVLVDNKKVYLLFAYPKNVSQEIKVGRQLSEVIFNESAYTDREKEIGLKNLKDDLAKSLAEKLMRKELYWISLFHKLSPDQKVKIEELKIYGLGFEEETERFYPEGDLASYVLGFVGVNKSGEDLGYYGLEGFYNGDLMGEPGKIYEEQTASGNPILLGGYKKIPPKNGRDLYTTINRSVQFIAAQGIKNGVEKFGAKSGDVVIMDPSSGAILAMATYPSFDPGSWSILARQMGENAVTVSQSDSSKELPSFRNPIISASYEPGSVLKALTMSAGIATNGVTPQTTFNDSGPLFVGGYRVDNWNQLHLGIQNMVEVLQKSNNMGAAFVARTIGAENLRNYFLKFGLGSKTGIDLEGEDSGVVKQPRDFKEIDLVTNSFGQGISVTPLQLTAAFGAIANGGVLYKPYVVSSIRDEKKTVNFKPEAVRQVLTPEKGKIMIEMLTAAAEGGEGKFFVLKNYRVAGKTGTAQIPTKDGYDPQKSNATFIGFLPDNPKFVMLVKLSQPSTSIYAAETAVPLWMEIAKNLVTYFGLSPDR